MVYKYKCKYINIFYENNGVKISKKCNNNKYNVDKNLTSKE